MRFTLVLLLVITQKHGQSVPAREMSYSVLNSEEVDTEILHRYKILASHNSFGGINKQFRVSGTEFHQARTPTTKNIFDGIAKQYQGPLEDPFYKKIEFNKETSTSHLNKQTLHNQNPNPGATQETNKFISRSSPNNKKNEVQKNNVSSTESSSVDVNTLKKCIVYQNHIPTPKELHSFLLTLWKIIKQIFIYILCHFSQCVC